MLLRKKKSCKVCNKKTTADKGTSEVVTMSEARKLLSIACVHTCTPAACGMASSECDSLPKDILQAWSSLKWQCRSGTPILRQLCLPLASPQIEGQQNLCKLLFGLELDPVEESIKTLGTTVFASMREFHPPAWTAQSSSGGRSTLLPGPLNPPASARGPENFLRCEGS